MHKDQPDSLSSGTDKQIISGVGDLGWHTGLSPSTLKFLTDTDIPEKATPLFSFWTQPQPYFLSLQVEGLSRVVRAWEGVPVQIGIWDGSNPVVIDPNENYRVWVMSSGGGLAPQFLNTSVAALAACLREYQNFVAAAQLAVGEDAFHDGDFPDAAFEALRLGLEQADPACLAEGAFWSEQLTMELAMRRDYRRSLKMVG